MEEFRLNQLTKELVAAKLREMDDPCAAAAALVAATLRVALRSVPEDPAARASAIEDACRGGITGLLLAEQNLAKGAVALLRSVAEVARDLPLDPSLALEAALKGIADARRFVLPERFHEMRVAVEASFMGAGDALNAIVEAQKRAGLAPNPTGEATS